MQRGDGLTGQIDETIESVAELERRALDETSAEHRAIVRLTLAVGRPRTAGFIVAAAAIWVALNLALKFSGHRAWDEPPFFWMDTVFSLAALLVTTLVLTTENRMSEIAEQRSRLHLQVSLLADRKAAKIIALLEELRYDLPSVPNREDSEAEELTLPSDPREVAQELERRTPNRGGAPGP